VVLTGASVAAVQTFVSIGGQVRKPGKVDFQKNMTLMSAIQASGDRTEFGGNTLFLRRAGKVLKLNYREEAVKNMLLLPDDVISVEERGPFER
jgi:protein involved in polysaccharide export with SLBB domain